MSSAPDVVSCNVLSAPDAIIREGRMCLDTRCHKHDGFSTPDVVYAHFNIMFCVCVCGLGSLSTPDVVYWEVDFDPPPPLSLLRCGVNAQAIRGLLPRSTHRSGCAVVLRIAATQLREEGFPLASRSFP